MRKKVDMAPSQVSARPWIVRSRSWVSILVIAPFAIATALSVPTVKEDTLADFVFGVVGWVCFCTGAMFRWWATLYIGGRKQQELATEGPYSICRNPLYLGTFLLTLSIAFFLHSITFAVGLLIATPLYLSITVPWEEARLLELFGDKYATYRSRVPKFIPAIRRIQSPSVIPVSLSGLLGEFRISLRWLWIPFLTEVVAHLRMESWWPDVLRLP